MLQKIANYIINNGTYPTNKIKSQIIGKGQVILYLKGSWDNETGVSKYGNKWAGKSHWVAILDYRRVNNKEEIYVSDSGHNKTGWHPIDEFDWMAKDAELVNER